MGKLFRLLIVASTLCGFALGQATEKLLYSFGPTPDVYVPSSNPIVSDSAGNLYGVGLAGGGQGAGGVFELLPNSDGNWGESVIYSFCPFNSYCPTGANPTGLAIDNKGNLFGTAVLGGLSQCCGVVFELSPPSAPGGAWDYSVIYDFCSLDDCLDGGQPSAPTLDKSGNLFGTTGEGGSANSGVVWELSPSAGGWTETVLYNFCSLPDCTDGEFPEAAVVLDLKGNLYGTTRFGGTGRQDKSGNTGGTLWELTSGSGVWTERVLGNFPQVGEFNDPYLGPASLDPLGNAYTTFTLLDDDQPVDGTVVRLNQKGDAEVFTFTGTEGITPLTGVHVDPARQMLYGTTDGHGGTYDPCGSVFQIDKSFQETVLYNFCQYSGDAGYPGALYEDASGNLYGSGEFGGANGYGAVFEVTP